MKDLTTYHSIKKEILDKGYQSRAHFSREETEKCLPGSGASLIRAILCAMPSIDDVIIIEHGIGEISIVLSGEPTVKELSDGTEAVENVLPCGILVRSHVVSPDDFTKMIPNIKSIDQ